MIESRIKISGGGRVVIPADYRKVLGIEEGDEMIIRLGDDGTLHLLTIQQSIKHAQELVRRYVPKERSLANELIAERRMEYENE